MKKLLMMSCVVACLGVPWANATVEVRIQNVGFGDTGWIQCAGFACSFVGTVGNYSFTSNVATQDNNINPFLDMNYSARTTSSHAGTLIIEAMADGYTSNTTGFEMVADGNGTIHSASEVVAAYGGNNNAICAAGVNGCSPTTITSLITSATFANPPNSYHFDQTGAGNSANPYSLGISLTVNNPTSAGSLSGDVQIDAVPEPASVALFGGVLLFTMTAIRRKMRHSS